MSEPPASCIGSRRIDLSFVSTNKDTQKNVHLYPQTDKNSMSGNRKKQKRSLWRRSLPILWGAPVFRPHIVAGLQSHGADRETPLYLVFAQ